MDVDYSGQTDIFNPSAFIWPVHIIGLGGIGSALVLPLVKLGLRGELHLWDFDAVEPHNIPGQLIYRPSDNGLSKVKATASFLERQEAQCPVVIHDERVAEDTALSGVVISGVDSMAARQDIWRAVRFNPEVVLYMDGRIGGEELALNTLNPSDFDASEWYEGNQLFDDADAAPLPCAARTVIHPPTILAGLMVAQLTLFARGMPNRLSSVMHSRTTQLINLK